MIKVKNLHKYFGELHVLKGIDLEVKQGDVIAIIGPSGSGKSTMLHCINRLEEPSDGHIYIDNEDIMAPDCDINAIRQKVGMVFQHFNLFPHKTVLENITLAPSLVKKVSKDEAEKTAYELLAKVGLSDKALSYPNKLSGGQKQRIAIARALAMKPEVILFDEPTSALDPISTKKIEELMQELRGSITMLIVTHNMQQAARISDRTAFMYMGELVEEDATDVMFTNPKKQMTEEYITGKFG